MKQAIGSLALLMVLALLGKAQFAYYPVNTGGVDRPDFKAHLGCASAKEVASWLGPKMVRLRELAVILPLVVNRDHAEPLRVSPATVHLKLASGEILDALSPEEVAAWARKVGVPKLPHPEVLTGIEVKKGEAGGFAAVFRLPKGANASRVEAEMRLSLGADEALQVKTTLY